MAVPVHEVLTDGAPEQSGRPSRALAAAVAVAAVLAAALVVVLERDPEPQVPVPVEVVGWLIFDDFSAQRLELPVGRFEERDETARGIVRLALPDRELRGGARLEYDASLTLADQSNYALHSWGDVTLQFGAIFCEGTFAWSNAERPLEGGGALQVRCDDGAMIAGRLAATPQPDRDMAIDLRDGWYVAGGEPG